MNIIECIAVTFSLISILFIIKNNILSWPVGMIGIIFYGIHFYNLDLYGNMILQFLFISQSIYGWYNWKVIPSNIEWLNEKWKRNIISITILLSLIAILLLSLSGDKYPIFDGITTSLSIIGILLLTYRKINNWIYWIIADIFYIIFFFYIGDYLSTITYVVFLILAFYGLKEWKKIYKVKKYEKI